MSMTVGLERPAKREDAIRTSTPTRDRASASAERRRRGAAGSRRSSRGSRQRRRQEAEAHVPKMKSHKGAQKRFGVTGSGKVYRVKSWRGHHLEIKSSRRTRRYAGKAILDPTTPRRSGACCRTSRSSTEMARVKRGVAAHKRHKRLLKAAEGRRGTRSKLIKPAREAQLHAMAYAYRGRKQRKRQLRACGSSA